MRWRKIKKIHWGALWSFTSSTCPNGQLNPQILSLLVSGELWPQILSLLVSGETVAVPCCFHCALIGSIAHTCMHRHTHVAGSEETLCLFAVFRKCSKYTHKTRQVCTVLADHLRYLYFIWYQFMYMCPVYVCVHVCSYASVWIKEIESMFSCADSTLCVRNEKVCSAVLTVHFVPWMKKYVQLWWQ